MQGHAKAYTKRMNTDISNYEKQFLTYAQAFCEQEKHQRAMLELKVIHSQAVLAHMRKLVLEETLAPYARACLLAALFHDVARFEQFKRWRTFKDAHSTNHGLLGVKILKEQGWLNGEDKSTRTQVFAAVSMHNRFSIPSAVPEDIRLITLALRDADKLDILRVMCEHFSDKEGSDSAVTFYAKDDPKAWSENIIKAILEHRLASYADIVYVNDFKLLLGSWLHELHFETTKNALAKSNYLESILQDVPNDEPVQHAKKYILNILKQLG